MPLGYIGNDEGKTRWPSTKHFFCEFVIYNFLIKKYVGDSIVFFYGVYSINRIPDWQNYAMCAGSALCNELMQPVTWHREIKKAQPQPNP